MPHRPLRDVQILDLTRWMPGPYASLILADLGAEVLKVEEPRFGDPMRHLLPRDGSEENVLFELLNRDKKSLTLNLKSSEGKAIFCDLVHGADVVLEGFRPGVMRRLGLDYESLAAVNPSLIYASISGFGQDGPYQSRAGHDLGYLAVAGLLGLTGPRDGPPIVPGIPVADLFAALWAALGVVTALTEREQTGRGRHLDISLLDSVSSLLALPLAEWRIVGAPPQRGNMLLSGRQACYNVYQTADGGYMALAALEPHFWHTFCEAVERPDWQPRQYGEDQASLVEEVAALFRSQPRAHWEVLFAEFDCCCEPVLDLDESFDHPQVVHRGLLRGRWLATPFTPAGAHFTPAPNLGKHSAQTLTELGYTAKETERLQQNGVI
jgi:alpha-methylacyl-CoA racemase